MNPLFHQDAIVAPLGSGSRGNCTYIGDGRRGVLVDCGLSTRQIFKRLEAIGLADTRIDAVLITHEHSDHVGAARVLSARLARREGAPVPFHMTRGTARNLHPNCVPEQIAPIRAGGSFQVGGFTVEPVTIPHDTQDPVSFTVAVRGVRIGVITDLGRSTRLVERQLASLDVAVLEFNHDLEMLLDGPYPWQLKQRVRGPHGHLSNAQAAELVRNGASSRLRHLVLAHLSEENNQPELALEAAQEALSAAPCQGVQVHVATQQEPLTPMRVSPPRDFRPPPRRRGRSEPLPPDDADRQISLF